MASLEEVFAEINKRIYGGARIQFESPTPRVINVGTTATPLLSANDRRIGWVVVNKSSNPGHLDYSNQVSTTRGFPVAQNGGSVDASYEDGDGATVQSAVFGINETAAGDWYVVAWELAP